MGWVAGVDVGGTFTDIMLVESDTGRRLRHKVPSTPAEPQRAIIGGLRQIVERHGVAAAALERLAHGTTAATNALIERRGGRVALVTTAGFRDVLEIGRQTRPKLYDLRADHPEPLVPRELRLEIRERVGPGGEVIEALTEDEIGRIVQAIGNAPCDAVAVGLLFSFANPEHERRIGDALRRAFPERPVSLSCEVRPEFREYERLSTTVLNAYLQPVIDPYVRQLESTLAELSGRARLDVCQSSGGLMTAARAASMPVRTVLSGPAAGVIGALDVALRAGHRNIITFDMGGTSTDVCLVRDGRAEMAYGRSVAGFPVRLPSLDIHTVGAGGGSIARIDTDGLLKVGPQSAGADPGPACYGKGGVLPTVSDANVVLGRLPSSLIGGAMALDRTRAEAAVGKLADSLGLSPIDTALGIIRVVNSNMVRAIRAVSVERGWDPRNFTLMPFGGAGPLHAIDVARDIGMTTVLVPPSPGILCAEGVAAAGIEEAFVVTERASLDGDLGKVRAAAARLASEADAWFARNHVADGDRTSRLMLDMRYVGQNYELSVPVPPGRAIDDVDSLRDAFHSAHATRYGHHDDAAAIEVVNVRLAVAGSFAASLVQEGRADKLHDSDADKSRQRVWFDGAAAMDIPALERERLRPGHGFDGPALITQLDATTLVPPGCRGRVLADGSLLVEVNP